jgi:hypothetical protein
MATHERAEMYGCAALGVKALSTAEAGLIAMVGCSVRHSGGGGLVRQFSSTCAKMSRELRPLTGSSVLVNASLTSLRAVGVAKRRVALAMVSDGESGHTSDGGGPTLTVPQF